MESVVGETLAAQSIHVITCRVVLTALVLHRVQVGR